MATATKSLAELQAKWLTLHDRTAAFRDELKAKYGEYTWQAPRGKQARLGQLEARADAASDAIFAWLDDHSPRCWRSHAPAHWTCRYLTETDALTAGQLSVTPPCSYGRCPSDMERLAAPVQQRELMPAW